jgi:hypothetical protein
MGLDLYVCAECGDACTGYNGGCLERCGCQKWVCYDCLEMGDAFRSPPDNGNDTIYTCPFCVEELKQLNEKERVINLINVKQEYLKFQIKLLSIEFKDDEKLTFIIQTLDIIFNDLMKLKEELRNL